MEGYTNLFVCLLSCNLGESFVLLLDEHSIREQVSPDKQLC